MEQFIYENGKGESIELSPATPFVIKDYEGLNGLENIIDHDRLVNQDGTTISNENLGVRYIVLTGTIIDNVARNRLRLSSVINPKLGGVLQYKKGNIIRKIPCRVEKTPVLNNEIYPEFIIYLFCPNPYLLSIHRLGQEISSWIGGLQFPFSLPFALRQRGGTRQNIINSGDVATPLEIIFKGPALNPKITNHTTGEYIKIDRELTTDDTLYITTHFGNKRVEVERFGEREDAHHYMDLDSTFFKLQAGDNLIEYTTEDELVSQGVEVRYYNRYLGI
mgnify:FL=1